MLSKSLAFAILAAPLALSQSAQIDRDHSQKDATGRYGCPNTIDVEPILIMNVSGSTLVGPVSRHLTVYSNGLAVYSAGANPPGGLEARDLQLAGPPSTIPVALAISLSIDVANQLVDDLRRANAHRLCDQTTQWTDVPLKTVTLLESRPDALAHTFSFYGATGPYREVDMVMDSFLETYFPGL